MHIRISSDYFEHDLRQAILADELTAKQIKSLLSELVSISMPEYDKDKRLVILKNIIGAWFPTDANLVEFYFRTVYQNFRLSVDAANRFVSMDFVVTIKLTTQSLKYIISIIPSPVRLFPRILMNPYLDEETVFPLMESLHKNEFSNFELFINSYISKFPETEHKVNFFNWTENTEFLPDDLKDTFLF